MDGAPVPRSLVDAFGNPFTPGGFRHQDPSQYKAGSMRAAEVASWYPRSGSPDADLLPDQLRMRSRARDLDRNSGLAKGGIQTVVDNVVGTGMRLSARPDYLRLKQTKEWQQEFAQQVEAFWCEWFWSTACHAGDTLTGDQITQQVFRAQLMNGEAIALPLWMPDRDPYATKIQLIESDRLSQPYGNLETIQFRAGIETDSYGAPLAYWIRRSHPGDLLLNTAADAYTWDRIPRKFDFGRLRVLHIFEQQRPGQSRGIPVLAPVLAEFKQLDRYQAAELMAAVVNAMVAMTIETPMSEESIVELFKDNPDSYMQQRRDHAVEISNGKMLPLFPGDKANAFAPVRPASQFGQFVTSIERLIGLPLDLPYELLTKDFSQTNYSSARAALLEAWRSFLRRRDLLATQFLDPIYALFLEELIDAGKIEAPQWETMRGAYLRCRWIGPGRGWVDPVKEAQAAQLRVQIQVSTLEDECAEQGKDWREVLEQLALEKAERERLGLDPIPNATEPRQIIPPGTPGAPDKGLPDENPDGEPLPTKPPNGGPRAPAQQGIGG